MGEPPLTSAQQQIADYYNSLPEADQRRLDKKLRDLRQRVVRPPLQALFPGLKTVKAKQ
jgi:hypothetical protein